MKGKALKRYALLLVVILCLQEVTNAAYISRPLYLQVEKDNEELNAIAAKTNSDENSRYEGPKQKRIVTVILLGVALLATSFSIATEIYFKINGCCKTNSAVCRYENEFNIVKKNITAENQYIDATWGKSQEKSVWIDHTNVQNERLWNEIERITGALESIIFGISPETQIQMEKFKNATLKAIEAGNKTVQHWTAAQLSAQYQSYFDGDWKFTTTRVGGYLFLGSNFIYKVAHKRAQARNLRNFVAANERQFTQVGLKSKSIKLFGDPNDLLVEAKQARVNSVKHKTRFQKLQKIGSGIVSLGLVGLEIWMTIEKFKQCDTIESTLKDARNNIRVDQAKILELRKNVTTYHSDLINTYNTKVKDQVTQQGVKDFLTQIREMISNTTPIPALVTATNTINEFLTKVDSSVDAALFNLVKKLTTDLKIVEFTINCWKMKTQSLKAIKLRCKSGNKDLKEIYDAVILEYGTNEGKCTTQEKLPYTNYADIQKSIAIYAVNEKFDVDCKLNNVVLGNGVCADKCEKYTNVQIKTKRHITINQVKAFIAKCPAKCPMSLKDKEEICNAKGGGYSVEVAYFFKPSYPKPDVKAVFDLCPTIDPNVP